MKTVAPPRIQSRPRAAAPGPRDLNKTADVSSPTRRHKRIAVELAEEAGGGGDEERRGEGLIGIGVGRGSNSA